MGLAVFTHKSSHAGGIFFYAAYFRAACLLLVVVACLAFSPVSFAADAPLAVTSYKMAGDATKMRIVMNFDREPDVKWFLLRGPHRLVVDLPSTKFAINAKDVKARGLVR
ncbi:MAG: AMIN domain-containing protein, partial [Mesorhizobium sp.]